MDAATPRGHRLRLAEGGPGRADLVMQRVTGGRLLRAAWAILILLVTAGAVTFGLAHQDFLRWVAVPLTVVATAPLLVLRRWPSWALGLVAASNAVFVVVARLHWPPLAAGAWLLALVLAPLFLSRGRAVILLGTTGAAILAAIFVPASVNPRPWDAPVTEALAILLLWGFGENLRNRLESRAHRAEIAGQVLDLQKREAAARGRAELARELHDVVAHHVSLIAVRAATAPYQLKDLPPAAEQTLAEIAAQARMALEELRAVLGVLRAPDGQAPQAPQPTLAQLPDLLERVRATGMAIEATTAGAAGKLPDNVELCCYRLVQEALTNAGRHAPGAAVRLTLTYIDQAVDICVSNAVAEELPAPHRDPGTGYGLTGMRERVTALGGTFQAGATGARFRVQARLPLTVPALTTSDLP